MGSTRDLDALGWMVAAAGVVLLACVGRHLVRHLRRPTPASAPGTSTGEGMLRELVRLVGAQLNERGVSDEDELDAPIAEAKRKAYERRYTSAADRKS